MQIYTIFNKHNKVSIAKKPFNAENLPKEQIIHCNSEILNSYDFKSLFNDNQTKDFFILTDTDDIDMILKKITSSLYFVKAAGGIVRNEKGEYLFMFRNGFWDLPKGHWENGETIEQTAKREVLEECGMQQLEVKNFLNCTFHTYHMNGRKEIKQTFWYNMFCSSQEALKPQTEEGIKYLKWITQEDLPKILSKSHQNIQHLFKRINSNS